MTDFVTGSVLFVSGLVAGAVGAVAGGGALVTFPVLLFAGLDPVMATASGFVALMPSGFTAAVATRRHLDGTRGWFLQALPTIFLGSSLGACLLMITPVSTFSYIFPVLLLFATLAFMFAPNLRFCRLNSESRILNLGTQHALLFMAALYGGFFGAGVGIVFMAALTLTGWDNVHQTTAVKNLVLSIASIGMCFIFAAGHSISWGATVIVMAGALIGGYLGGAMLMLANTSWIRRLVIGIGLFLSLYYGLKIVFGH